MKSINRNKYCKIVWNLGFLFVGFFISSCSEKISYDEYVETELSKGIYYDSLVYGVHFGMTFPEFDSYCLEMNKKKIFMPNHSGTAVRLRLSDGFNAPVYFDFFPIASSNQTITELTSTMSYQDFSYYDKKYRIENLVLETKAFFEKGYGGNKFIEMAHENQLLKFNYIKIDGNRKIVLSPSFDGQMLNISFQNLNPEIHWISRD